MPNFNFNIRFFITGLVFLVLSLASQAQEDIGSAVKKDSVKMSVKKEGSAIKSKIKYQAKDSILFSVERKIVKLYHEAVVEYEDVNLKAEYIEINFNNKTIKAYGMPDSLGRLFGRPDFMQGDQKFDSDTIIYNYETKKGIIYDIFSEQGEGYLHGEKVKKLPDNTILVRDGSFTTCDLHDPHFEIKFNKAKVIPNDKIVTGPVWLVIEDIPTPLALPFGFFPNKKGTKSGILIPTYGQSTNRGFYLENGGYYFAISDYMDLALRADIYSRGSWGVKALSAYKRKYKYEGNFSISFAENVFGDKQLPDYVKYRDFFIKWRHAQDPKARPRSRFSADVQAGSSKYNTFNPSSTQDYLSSSYTSSVSYSTTFGTLFNFSANFRHTQNKTTHALSMNLPELSLSSSKIYPFRPKVMKGKPRSYQNINFSYQMNARNTINTIDSLLFDSLSLKNMDNGVKHTIPVSWNMKFLKYFNFAFSGTYTERWYFRYMEQEWNNVDSALLTNTVNQFRAAREFMLGSSLNTKMYVFYSFGRLPLREIRHVITPSATFSWRPDFSEQKYGYYRYYLTPQSQTPVMYSIFQNAMFGYPGAGKYSNLNLSLTNNFEMKVRNRKDTVTGTRKITLIDNLTLAINRNFAADSLQWSMMTVSGRTKLFKNFDLSYVIALDPYAMDSNGRRINVFQFDVDHRLFRRNNDEYGIAATYQLSNKSFRFGHQKDSTGTAIKYRVPWNLNLTYTFRDGNYFYYTSADFRKSHSVVFSGDIQLTPNWKISGMGSYDIITGKFTYATLNIHRDLHCWEIIFNWIPIGFRQSYNMTIRVKATMLQDLKLTKKTDWRDFY